MDHQAWIEPISQMMSVHVERKRATAWSESSTASRKRWS